MEKNNAVSFRRIRGRIVPIKLSKGQKQQAKGAMIAAAGVGVAAGGGAAYRAAVNKSASMSFKGFNLLDKAFKNTPKAKAAVSAQLSFFDTVRKTKLQNAADSALLAGKRLNSVSKTIRIGSKAIGAGLIGYGFAKALNGLSKQQKKKLNPELLAGGAASAAIISGPALRAANDAFTAGFANKQTAMKFTKNALIQHGPKIKEAVKAILKFGI